MGRKTTETGVVTCRYPWGFGILSEAEGNKTLKVDFESMPLWKFSTDYAD